MYKQCKGFYIHGDSTPKVFKIGGSFLVSTNIDNQLEDIYLHLDLGFWYWSIGWCRSLKIQYDNKYNT
jgi:hypothetical protein